MTENENVVKLPDALERRAIRIEAAIIRKNKSDVDWVDAVVELAVELFQAKNDFPSNTAFGKWFENRFANISKSPGEHERTILVRWGATPDDLRTVLAKEETRSIQMIARFHPNLGTPPRAYTKRNSLPPPPPKPNKIEAVAQVLKEETGEWPRTKTLAKVAGVNPRNADNALRTLKAVEAAVGAPSLPVFTKAQDHQVAARLKVLEAEFDERVRLGILAKHQAYRDKLEEMERKASEEYIYYRKLINNNNPIFTQAEYLNIVRACHPDNSASKETRDAAFRAVVAKKIALVGKK